MRVGRGEWGFRARPLEDHFRIAREFGFRTMEIGIGGGVPGHLPETVDAVVVDAVDRLRAAYEVATPFVCLENDFTLPDPAAQATMLRATLAQLAGAARLSW